MHSPNIYSKIEKYKRKSGKQTEWHFIKSLNSYFTEDYQELERIKNNILNLLNDRLQGKVHSIRARVKDADHLIEKIIRSVNDKPDKYAKINVDNYYKIVTDLIGVRIIILNKYDWKEIHQSLLDIFINDPKYYTERPEDIVENFDRYYNKDDLEGKNGYHAEKPIVYITSADDRDVYQDDNLDIDEAKKVQEETLKESESPASQTLQDKIISRY